MSDEAITAAAIVCMAAITVVTRAFFFLSARPWSLPRWARQGLDYAPVAALAAVIAPEVSMIDGHLTGTWRDARLVAALAAIAWFRWRRGTLGVIICGMAVYLPLHLGLGW